MKIRFGIAFSLLVFFSITATAQQRPPTPWPWRQTLEDRLPYYGHRNWIVVADSAYPLQSGTGIETILSNESQIDTVRHVLATLSKVRHVRPVVYTDKELPFIPEQDAVGILAYRQLLTGLFTQLLPDQKVVEIPHEDIIHKLDEAGKSFHVLIVKTNMTLPYTSVFFELRAAYWTDEAEQRLRQSIK
jgi:hypothetical protein